MKESLDMNTTTTNTTNTANLDFTPAAQVYPVKAVADVPATSVAEGMIRLPLGRSDGKKGKADRCIVVPECSDSVLALLLADADGAAWLRSCVDGKRKALAIAALAAAQPITSVTLGIDALRASCKNDLERTSNRLTRAVIAEWFARKDGLIEILAGTLRAKGLNNVAIEKTCDAFLVCFQKLVGRGSNCYLTEQEKNQLIKALSLIPEESELALDDVTQALSEKVMDVSTDAPVAMMDAL